MKHDLKQYSLIVIITAFLLSVFPISIKAEEELKIIGTPPTVLSGFTYDGEKHDIVKGGNLSVKDGKGYIQYSIKEEQNDWGSSIGQITDAGTYVIRYRGVDKKGNVFSGPHKIGKVVVKPVTNKFISKPVAASSFSYDGKEHPLFIEKGQATKGNIEYHYTYNGQEYSQTTIPNIKNAGTYKVYAETQSIVPNYLSEKTSTTTITINPIKLDDVTVTVGGPLTYNTKEQKITIKSVKSNSVSLTKNDYEIVSNSDTATNAGNYTLKIKGCGNYSFTATANWTINKLDITGGSITLGPTLTYSGNSQTQTIKTVKNKGGTVTLLDSDYTVSNNKQKNVGSYTLTVSGNNKNTTGSINKSWSIKPFTMNNDNVIITLGNTLTYNEKEQTQTIASVKIKETGSIINPSCYSISSNKGTNAKKYTLKIVGKDDSIKGSATKEWEIKKNVVTGTWSKNEFDYDGKLKEVHLNGLPSCAKVTYKNNTATKPGDYEAKATITISGNNNYVAGNVTPLKWKINKLKYDMSKIKFESKIFPYDGKPHSIEITGTLPKGVKVTYKNNTLTNTGMLTATASFTGDEYYEPIKDMTAVIKISNEIIAIPKEDDTHFVENGNEQIYKIEENDKYTISSNKQTNAGEYEVIVSIKDKNNYHWEDDTTDDKTYNFVIYKNKLVNNDIEITDDINGFSPNASLQVIYTENENDEDYSHITNINNLKKPHQDMNFAYLVKIIDNDTIINNVKVSLTVPEKFNKDELVLFNVIKDNDFTKMPFSIDNNSSINIDSLSTNEFVFLNNEKGTLIHILKILIICLYVSFIVYYAIIKKNNKINKLIIIVSAAYLVLYLLTGLYINCVLCTVLNIIALLVLLGTLIYFFISNKNNNNNNNMSKEEKENILIQNIIKEMHSNNN